jgi:hypothetical protein
MRHLTSITPLGNYRLACQFDNGVEKVADITQYLQSEAFRPLQNVDLFKTVENKEYYVEWLDGEVDLSADTLWHIGVDIQPS